MTERMATIIRVYRGKQQADAVRVMEPDAVALAEQGYFPTSQSWAQGQWGCGAFLVAIALMLALVGFLVFVYMLLVKPDGTLTVTYTLRTPTDDVAAKLAQLAALRDSGAVSADEYDAKRAELLARM